MHPEETFVQRIVRRQGRQAQQSTGRRYVGLFEKSLQLLLRTGQDDPLPDECQRPFRRVDEAGGLVQAGGVGLGHGLVAADEGAGPVGELRLLHLRVLGEVEHHRAGPSAAGDVEGPRHRPGHVLGAAYLVRPLGDGLRDAHHVNLLEGIRAQHGRGHLPGDDHHGRAVQHGIAHAGNHVRSPRPGGDQAHAHPARSPCVALSRVHRPLFVARKHVVQLVPVVVQRVEHRDDLPARIAEQGADPFGQQRSDEYFASC